MENPPKLDFHPGVYEALRLAPASSDGAVQALLIAAEYFRKREALLGQLADYLADAIECSMHKDQDYRNAALLRELYLTAENRRPVRASDLSVAQDVIELIDDCGYSQNKATKEVAENYGISASTAKRMYKKNRLAIEEYWEMQHEERMHDRESPQAST